MTDFTINNVKNDWTGEHVFGGDFSCQVPANMLLFVVLNYDESTRYPNLAVDQFVFIRNLNLVLVFYLISILEL
jgi:hypothetical protein